MQVGGDFAVAFTPDQEAEFFGRLRGGRGEERVGACDLELGLFEEDAADCEGGVLGVVGVYVDAFAVCGEGAEGEDRAGRGDVFAPCEAVFHEAVFAYFISVSCCAVFVLFLVLVCAVPESYHEADGDSEDFGEAAEAGVVAFAVFGRWWFVVGDLLVAKAGGLDEAAGGRSGCGSLTLLRCSRREHLRAGDVGSHRGKRVCNV